MTQAATSTTTVPFMPPAAPHSSALPARSLQSVATSSKMWIGTRCSARSRAGAWVASMGAVLSKCDVDTVYRSTEGTALLRVRATVAHDSYERLVEVPCSPSEHTTAGKPAALDPV